MTDYKAYAASLVSAPEERKLVEVKRYLSGISDESLRKEAARYLVSFPDGKDDAPDTVYVLLHGIRTGAEWQNRIAQQLESEHQITVIPCKYGVRNLVCFLVPLFRSSVLQRVERHLNNIQVMYPGQKIVVVAHSFGTWAIAELLKRKKVRVDRLLMCGAVVKQNFDWHLALPEVERASIVNDVGTKDSWPVVAHATAIGCGDSGFMGFGSPKVIDRFHHLGHSDFFQDEHVRRYWVPFLVEGRVVPSPHTESRPKVGWLKGFICSCPNGAVYYLLLIVMLVLFLM